MFEQRGWIRTGLIEGPAPLTPSSTSPTDLLVWADRAPANGAWLDAIRSVDPEQLTTAHQIALLRAWERLRRGVDAGFVTAVGAIAARPCRPEPGDPSCDGGQRCEHDWSVEDTGLALGVGRMTARALLDHSRELTTRLPGMLAEVADGRASLSAARRAAERTQAIADDGRVAVIADEIAGHALGKTVGAFDRHVATVVERLRDPAEVEAAHADAVRTKTGIRPLPPMEDGMGGAVILGPAAKIAALFGWAREFTTVNRHPDDTRTVGMRRVDALLAALLEPIPAAAQEAADAAGTGTTTTTESAAAGAAASFGGPATGSPAGAAAATGSPGSVGGAPDREAPRQNVALQLVLAASTLLGHDEEPGWLEGHGNLAAPLARALAVHPQTMQRLLTHPLTGHLLDLTPEVRVPSAALERYVRARDGSCTGPGCGGNARDADLDHIQRVTDEGPTTRANLHAPCKRDHRKRHPGGWTVRRNPDQSITWTDPHSNSYETGPTRYPGQPITRARNVIAFDLSWPDHTWLTLGEPDCTCPDTPGEDPDDATLSEDFDDLERKEPPPGGAGDAPEPPPEPPCPF